MLIPPFLQKGSVVRLVSPAGVIDAELVEGAERCLKNWGLIVRIGQYATTRNGRFAGSSEQRLSDLQEALEDPECSALFCTRGGYGTVQLIDKLNWEAFRKHPKWLIGYSDITMLHETLSSCGVARDRRLDATGIHRGDLHRNSAQNHLLAQRLGESAHREFR